MLDRKMSKKKLATVVGCVCSFWLLCVGNTIAQTYLPEVQPQVVEVRVLPKPINLIRGETKKLTFVKAFPKVLLGNPQTIRATAISATELSVTAVENGVSEMQVIMSDNTREDFSINVLPKSPVYPSDLAYARRYHIDLGWADHQVVPMTQQPFGSGNPSSSWQTSPYAEMWIFGTSKENKFPCRGWLYKSDGELIRFYGPRDERVAAAFETPEELDVLLRKISHLNSADSGSNFQPRRLIQLGREMNKVSSPDAFWSLVEFNRIAPSEWKGHNGVPLIIKYLYPNDLNKFYNFRNNQLGFDGESNKQLVERYPNFPIVVLKGIPFCTSYGYTFGGQGKLKMTIPKDVEIPEVTAYTIESKLTVGDVIDEIESDSHQLLFAATNKERVLSQLNSLVSNKPIASSVTKSVTTEPALKVEDFEGVRSWEWNDDSCMFEENEGTPMLKAP